MWLVAKARLERNVRYSAAGARQPLGGFVEAASSQGFPRGTGIEGTKCAGQVMGMHANGSTYRGQADRIRIGVVQVFPCAMQPARRGARRRKPGCRGDKFVAETLCMEIGIRFPLRKLSQQSPHQRVWARGCDLDWTGGQHIRPTLAAHLRRQSHGEKGAPGLEVILMRSSWGIEDQQTSGRAFTASCCRVASTRDQHEVGLGVDMRLDMLDASRGPLREQEGVELSASHDAREEDSSGQHVSGRTQHDRNSCNKWALPYQPAARAVRTATPCSPGPNDRRCRWSVRAGQVASFRGLFANHFEVTKADRFPAPEPQQQRRN